jgi:hypothetical protein
VTVDSECVLREVGWPKMLLTYQPQPRVFRQTDGTDGTNIPNDGPI